MNIKTLFSGMLLLAATTASAQYIHIKLTDGTVHDYDSKTIESMIVDNQAPKPAAPQAGDKVEGTVTIDGKTYTKTVGGTIGEAVDLGLPSGTLWASHNIGASQPEEYGACIAWGELGTAEEHYTNGIKSDYSWSSYKYCNNGDWTGLTKYTFDDGRKSGIWYSNGTFVGDGKTELEAMDDAAAFNWGGDWRMPTYEEQEELRTKCTWTWVTDVKDANGKHIYGYKVVGPNGNCIFLPAAGWRGGGSFNVNWYGYYWSSSLSTTSYFPYELLFHSNSVNWAYYERHVGESVRPVRSE